MGAGIYFFAKKGPQESTQIKSISNNIPEEGEDFESEQISYTLNGEECKGIFLEAISRIE